MSEELNTLPPGWTIATFGDLNMYVSSNINPGHFSDEVFDLYSVTNFYKNEPEIEKGSNILSVKQILMSNDIMICKINPRINRVWKINNYNSNRKIGSSEWIVFRSTILHLEFYKFFFQSPTFRNFLTSNTSGVGGSLTRIQPKKVYAYSLPVPPLLEQIRIADKLSTLDSKINTIQLKLERILILLETFYQSVIHAAMEGKITGNCEADWKLPWRNMTLEELAISPLRNGKSVKDGDGGRVLRSTALSRDGILWEESKRGDWEGVDHSKFLVKEGDFLISRGSGTRTLVGRGALVTNVPESVAFPDTIICFRPDEQKILPKFLNLIWQWEGTKKQIYTRAKTTAGIWKINQKDLASITIKLPSLQEQEEIVRRVESILEIERQIDALGKSTQSTVNLLMPIILFKAFQGKLIAQSSTDEASSVLIEATYMEKNAKKPTREKTNPIEQTQSAAHDLDSFIEIMNSTKMEMHPENLLEISKLKDNIELFYKILRQGQMTGRLKISKYSDGNTVSVKK